MQGSQFRDMLVHMRQSRGFTDETPVEVGLFSQCQGAVTDDLSMHDVIRVILLKEWEDPDMSSFPRFLDKLLSDPVDDTVEALLLVQLLPLKFCLRTISCLSPGCVCSLETLALMELWAMFLSVVSFDVLWSSVGG